MEHEYLPGLAPEEYPERFELNNINPELMARLLGSYAIGEYAETPSIIDTNSHPELH